MWTRYIMAALFVPAMYAQPLIYARAVVDAASFMPPGLPGGSIALASVFSIFGTRLGPASSAALVFPLAPTRGGVSVMVSASDGSSPVNAIPLFVGPGQINAILPSNAPPVRIATSQFGIYSVGGGLGPGICQNFNAATDQPVNALNVAAKPGQTITMWGTGLGKVTFQDSAAPTPDSLPTPVEVFVAARQRRSSIVPVVLVAPARTRLFSRCQPTRLRVVECRSRYAPKARLFLTPQRWRSAPMVRRV